MGRFDWKELTHGSHPPVSRLKHKDSRGKHICYCQVPDQVVTNHFTAMFFRNTRGELDSWVVDMIRLADVGFVD